MTLRIGLWLWSFGFIGFLVLVVTGRVLGFEDDDGHVSELAIDTLKAQGILAGTDCGESNICPDGAVLRWVMAVWIVRARDLGSPETLTSSDPLRTAHTTGFIDIDPDVWWAPYVEHMAALGITSGCGSGSLPRFCPYEKVTRGQMATFLVKAFDLESTETVGFVDTVGSIHGDSIDILDGSGVADVCAVGRFCPDEPVTRGQMATFLARALGLVPITPRPVTGLVQVSVGARHSCGVRVDRSVVCWGDQRSGQTDTPRGEFRFVSAGSSHSCGVRVDGSVVCWGDNDSGQLDVAEGEFGMVSAGSSHSCGISLDRTVVCWGSNGFGRADTPRGEFRFVSAGSSHSCGVRVDGSVVCWGGDEFGQLQVPEGDFRIVSAGSWHSCGLDRDRNAVCWGSNNYGQSDGPEGEFGTVSAGGSHSCGVRIGGLLSCWGSNNYGQLDVPEGQFRSVSAGGSHSCGVRRDGSVVCWGSNGYGRTHAPEGQFRAVVAGGYYSCGILTDGNLTCWDDEVVSPPEVIYHDAAWGLVDLEGVMDPRSAYRVVEAGKQGQPLDPED